MTSAAEAAPLSLPPWLGHRRMRALCCGKTVWAILGALQSLISDTVACFPFVISLVLAHGCFTGCSCMCRLCDSVIIFTISSSQLWRRRFQHVRLQLAVSNHVIPPAASQLCGHSAGIIEPCHQYQLCGAWWQSLPCQDTARCFLGYLCFAHMLLCARHHHSKNKLCEAASTSSCTRTVLRGQNCSFKALG